MALFVPNPEQGPVEDLIEQLSVEIATRYRDAEDTLIREIAKRAVRDMALSNELPTAPAGAGLTVEERRRQNRILAELAAHRAASMRELQGIAIAMVEKLRSEDLARRMVNIAANEGEAAAAAQLGFAQRQAAAVAQIPFIGGPVAVSVTTLPPAASQAVAMVALSLQSSLEILNQRLTRYPADAYQRIVAMYSPGTLLGTTTSREQQALAVQRFLAAGIPGFEDRSGRWWRIGSYAEMAGRTTVNRAYNDAGVWRMQQDSVNLVTIARGVDSCRRCAEWTGKILSTDGTTGTVQLASAVGGDPVTVSIAGTVSDARNAGWGHPNCRCRLVPYLAGLSIPQSDSTYDEAAENERAKQRELERDIRAAKRAEATAMNDADRARAARDVREAQAAMREFVRDTGRARQSYREQLHFAGGTGATPQPSKPRQPAAPTGIDIRVKRSTDIGAAVYASRSSISRVHTIPNGLPHLPVETARLPKGVNGVYYGSRSVLQVSANGSSPRLTFAHEVGHYLDHRLLGADPTKLESRIRSDPATAAWLRAVEDTEAAARLRALRANPATPKDIREHIDYLLSPAELWGRSYAQYIATRSADTVMLAEIAAFRRSLDAWTADRQWGTTDFEPVAAAIDAIFRGKGLLK